MKCSVVSPVPELSAAVERLSRRAVNATRRSSRHDAIPRANICLVAVFACVLAAACGANEAPTRPVTAGGASGPPDMVRIHAGTFTMGSPVDEPGHADDEQLRTVTLTRNFWLSVSEITQAEYQTLMGTHISEYSECGRDCPVERVSWLHAVAYANARSRAEGLAACYDAYGLVIGGATIYDCRGYRLPTEAEWEYAARAGTSEATYAGKVTYLGRRNAPELLIVARYGGNSSVTFDASADCSGWSERARLGNRCGPQPAATTHANPWGLRGMLGNVMEWTHDRYSWYEKGPATDPAGAETTSLRVVRGCSWCSAAVDCRSASRHAHHPPDQTDFIGFRLARTAP